MLVSFEHCKKIIANANLSFIPNYGEEVTIFGVVYEVIDCRHEVEIKIKQSGKKCVVEKNICVVSAIRDKE
jgi:hypothetical protein